MEKYPIHITSDITLEKLQQGLFLFIYRASKIPPHIGVITNGMLYDITTIGPNIDLSVEDFYNTTIKRKTEVIFVELHQPDFEVNLRHHITEKVSMYWKVTSTTSCLHPIKDFITAVYQINVGKAQFIFELLPMLYERELIASVSQLNLKNKLTNSVFELNRYTEEDVEKCINALHRKEKQFC